MKRKIGNSWGVGGYTWPLWNGNSEGVGGSNRKNHPSGGYGYFLEPHYAWMHWPFTCQQSVIWPIRSWYQNLFSLTGDIKTKSTGYPSLFSHPPPTPLWSQFTGYCLTSWENACPHGQPSFSPTLCYCHHLICTQVTVSRPCPLSEFYINKAS